MGGWFCGPLADHMTSFTENEFHLAALEDRQEAAPDCVVCGMTTGIADDGYAYCGNPACFAYKPVSGVPLEATPSKETDERRLNFIRDTGASIELHYDMALDDLCQEWRVTVQADRGRGATICCASDRSFRGTIDAAMREIARLIGNSEYPDPQPGDTRCYQCDGVNPCWFAENELWNAVKPERVGVLCPVCFIAEAERRGFGKIGWKLAEPAPTPEVQGTPAKEDREWGPYSDTRETCPGFERGRGGFCKKCGWSEVNHPATPATAPAQTLAETPGFAEWWNSQDRNAWFASPHVEDIARSAYAKALHDARIWLFNQQGRANLPEILAELLKREREAGGVGGEEKDAEKNSAPKS